MDSAQFRVQVRVKVLPEPDMASVITNSHHLFVHYTPSYVVAQQLGLRSLVLSRISGNIQVEKGSPEKYVCNESETSLMKYITKVTKLL